MPQFITIILLIFINFSVSKIAFSDEKNFEIMERNKKFRLKKVKRKLKNLTSNVAFEGKHFKIVRSKDEKPILFSDSSLKLKAATTYFHLEKARSYFINQLNSEYVKKLPQITIRIEHTNKFNELGHFAHDNFEPQYNNALSIPAGKGYAPAEIKPWEMEIWFRPAKKIHISEIDKKNPPYDLKKIFTNFRRGVHMNSIQRFLMDYFLIKAYDNLDRSGSVQQFLRTTGTSIMLELALSQASLLERLITRRWYKLDAALIPEIIYHEFSHIALSDYLELNHSTSVIEGMADFFAGKISNSKELATKVKKYNSYNGKKVDTSTIYRQEFELTSMANTDFLFGLLWQINEIIDDPSVIYNMRDKIKTDSNIRDNLINGLFDTYQDSSNYVQHKKLELYRELYQRGI